MWLHYRSSVNQNIIWIDVICKVLCACASMCTKRQNKLLLLECTVCLSVMRSNICSLPSCRFSHLAGLLSHYPPPSPSTIPHKYPESALKYIEYKIWKSCMFAVSNLGYHDTAYYTHIYTVFTHNSLVIQQHFGMKIVVQLHWYWWHT